MCEVNGGCRPRLGPRHLETNAGGDRQVPARSAIVRRLPTPPRGPTSTTPMALNPMIGDPHRQACPPPDELLEEALVYRHRGFSTFPLVGGKKPAVKWKRLQERRATDRQIAEMFGYATKNRRNLTGVAVVCGTASSNVCVFDFDDPDAYAGWASAWPEWAARLPTSSTGRDGGRHVWFRCTRERCRAGSRYVRLGEFKANGAVRRRPAVVPHRGPATVRVGQRLPIRPSRRSLPRSRSDRHRPRPLPLHPH